MSKPYYLTIFRYLGTKVSSRTVDSGLSLDKSILSTKAVVFEYDSGLQLILKRCAKN